MSARRGVDLRGCVVAGLVEGADESRARIVTWNGRGVLDNWLFV